MDILHAYNTLPLQRALNFRATFAMGFAGILSACNSKGMINKYDI
jgi:hypothetical protein